MRTTTYEDDLNGMSKEKGAFSIKILGITLDPVMRTVTLIPYIGTRRMHAYISTFTVFSEKAPNAIYLRLWFQENEFQHYRIKG